MQFAQPLWLIAGAIVCATLVWLYRRFDRSRRSALTQFATERLLSKLTSSVSVPRRRLKRVLFTIGVGLLFVALARPQAGFEWRDTHRKGLELLFAVDTSKSMLAQDVKPDRLTRSKLAVNDLIDKLRGDGVGLVAFAGNAFLQCPVTLDYDAFRESLDALDTRTIPHGGSNIAAAIHEAEAVFQKRDPAEKILILITDGEDLGGEGIKAAKAAAKNGVKIFTVGVGRTAGELVPMPGQDGGTEFARDENGEFVKSHLDESTLKTIAEATGGTYQPLGTHGEGLTKIYEQGLATFTRQDLSSRRTKVPLERFQWALLAALAFFVSEWLIGNRRSLPSPKAAPAPAKTRRIPGMRPAAAALAILAVATSAHAATPQSAEQAYQNGDYAKAQNEYAAVAEKRPTKAELHFNAGAAAYKAGNYANAATAFQETLKNASVPVQQGAFYNLGNTQYRSGQKTEKTNPEETIKTWEESVKSYDAALQIAANDTAAKHNRDLVQRKIDELKKQQEQKKHDQKKKDQENQDQKNQQKDQSQKDQNQQNQPQNQEQHNQGQQDQNKAHPNPKNDATDQKDGNKDQQADSRKQQGESGEQQGASEDQKQAANDGRSDERKQQDEPTGGKNSAEKQKDSEPKALNAEKKPSQGKGKIEAAHGEKPGDTPVSSAEERRQPGQMTQEEAKALLEALKADERKAPAISAQGLAGSNPNENKPFKDW